MTQKPKVSIILLNWNQYALTASCINSLKQCTYPAIEIIVVDQASHDNSVSLLKAQYPEVRLIENVKNTGFTGGNNQGMKIATGEYFLLLNNDTEVESDFLEPLVTAARNKENVGACSPLIRYYSNPEYIQYAGGPREIDLIRGRNTWRCANEHLLATKRINEKTSAAHGAAFFIKRSVVEKIGMLDESLFIYYEEYDWSLRIRKAGYSIMFVADSTVFHKESMTLKKDNPFRMRQMSRNRLWLSRKHSSRPKYLIAILYVWFCSLPINIIRFALKKKFDLVGAITSGSYDGTFSKIHQRI